MAYQTGPRSESHLPGVTFLATNLSSHRHNKRANLLQGAPPSSCCKVDCLTSRGQIFLLL